MSKKTLYIETYGCQMNIADSGIVVSIISEINYELTKNPEDANLILINTCSVRDNAEQKVIKRLKYFVGKKAKNTRLLVGIIGCMAERLKEDLILNHGVDIVVGPDAYRSLPGIIQAARNGEKQLNVELSDIETYTGIVSTQQDNKISGFVSIMRGCNNFCSYCIVPYTRGRERSRKPEDILTEIDHILYMSKKEITLLGQNVNSYLWKSEDSGIKTTFPELLELIAVKYPNVRIRFTTSHPKDMSDETIEIIAKHKNICRHIHLPFQSGSSRILKLMNRKYDREWYVNRIKKIKELMPDCGLSTDVFSGFCGETEEDHKQTLSLMKFAKFDFAFMFKYSERPGTSAEKDLKDDIPENIKKKRLQEIIDLQGELSLDSNKRDIGKTFEVLAEGLSKKSDEELFGRNQQNKVVVFPKKNYKIGDYVQVKLTDCTSATLIGIPV
ncbi:tRNA (N6-isopentenyl adenosine(37)-C2)-methylthiotransferase MiaB [Bacteroidota bacterium]